MRRPCVNFSWFVIESEILWGSSEKLLVKRLSRTVIKERMKILQFYLYINRKVFIYFRIKFSIFQLWIKKQRMTYLPEWQDFFSVAVVLYGCQNEIWFLSELSIILKLQILCPYIRYTSLLYPSPAVFPICRSDSSWISPREHDLKLSDKKSGLRIVDLSAGFSFD